MKIGKNASETALLTLAYGEYATKKSSAFEWHRRFKDGRGNVQDDPRQGQPKMQKTVDSSLRIHCTGQAVNQQCYSSSI
jgi:hypothetical protein